MAASFPTSLKTFTTIDCNTAMNASGKSGVDIVTELQEEVAALQTKLGVDSSAVTTTHDYKLSGVTGSDKAVSKTGTETLTNKTLTSPVVNTSISGTAVLDEDNMASDSATKLATQQSIKAYVDTEVEGLDDGWIPVGSVFTYTDAFAQTYSITFASVDLTGQIGKGALLKWTQNSIVRYGIVQNSAFSTNTVVHVLTRCDSASTDYDVLDTSSFPATSVYYSLMYAPAGFPMGGDKWTIEVTGTSAITEGSGLSVWADVTNITIAYGDWDVGYFATVSADTANPGQIRYIFAGLSTANNSMSTDVFVTMGGATSGGNTYTDFHESVFIEDTLSLTDDTLYYLNLLVGGSDNTGTEGIAISVATGLNAIPYRVWAKNQYSRG